MEIEQYVYSRLGVTTAKDFKLKAEEGAVNLAEAVLINQGYTKGFTKFGDMYCVDGMRKSGDPNTSCGNTLINGLTHMYTFH